jgi:hypothetical protein
MTGADETRRWALAVGAAAVLALAGFGASFWAGRGAGKSGQQVPEAEKVRADAVSAAAAKRAAVPARVAGPSAGTVQGPARGASNSREENAAERDQRRAVETARARVAELEAANERLRARLDDMLSWIVDNVQGRFPLPEGQMANLRISPATEDGMVSEDLAEVLRMTDEETARLDDAWTGAMGVLRELEEGGIRVEDGDGETWAKLAFAPYGEDGGLVRDYLYEETLATLGKGRFLRFLQVAGAGLEDQFDSFGDRERTLEINVLADGGEGESLFIRDEVRKTDPEDPMKQTGTSVERVTGTLPKEYERYLGHFPELVGRFAESGGGK